MVSERSAVPDPGSPDTPNATEGGPANATNGQDAETIGTVTLLTGHRIRVVERDGDRTYELLSNGTLQRYDTPRGTYFFPEDVDLEKFHPSLFNVDLLVDQGLGTDGEPIPVLVRFGPDAVGDDGGDTGHGVEAVRRFGLSARRTLESIDAVSARVGTDDARGAYERLANAASVERVSPDLKVTVGRPVDGRGESHSLPDETATLGQVAEYVEADDARREHDVTGEGVTVAVVDSGVDETHPAIEGDELSEKGFARSDDNTTDTVGHGTHVAGIVTAEGPNASYTGIAPDAEILDLSVGRQRAFTSVVADAMEYADRNGADVVSMSLGLPARSARSSSVLNGVTRRLVENGTLVVVSAGNSGPNYETVSSPGTQKGMLTVGATTVNGTAVTSFSSRGPTGYEYGVKPDLVAPGSRVVSTATSRGYIFDEQGWGPLSGTSMSAPVVSGTAALLWEAEPNLTPREVKRRLVATADRFDGPDVYTQGGGQVNVEEAIETPLTVEPATLDFGVVELEGSLTRTVTVHNDGSTARTVPVSASAKAVRRNETADGSVSTNVSEITVPAGGSASFEVTITTDAADGGVYSGRLRVGDQSTSFGWAEPYTVTVRKSALPDQSVDGDTVGIVPIDEGSGVSRTFATLESEDDVARFTTTASRLAVFSVGEAETPGGRSIHTAKTVEVAEGTSVVLDESNTSVVRIDDGEIEDEAGELRTLQQRSALVNDEFWSETVGTEVVNTDGVQSSVRFSRSGFLWTAFLQRIAVPESDLKSGTGFPVLKNGSDVYAPSETFNELRGDRTVELDPDEMASMRFDVPWLGDHQRFSASIRFEEFNRTETVGLAGTTPSFEVHGEGYDVDVNVTGTDTRSGDSWSSTFSGFYASDGGESTDVQVQPLTSYAEWYVADSAVYLGAFPQLTQSSGRYSAQDQLVNFTVGDQSFRATTDDGLRKKYDLPNVENGTRIRLQTRGHTTAHEFSTWTNATYEATYYEGRDSSPPGIAGVRFENLRHPNNSIPPSGGTVRVRVSERDNLLGLEAYVSAGGPARPFETGGDGWVEASVVPTDESDHTNVYRVEFDASQFEGEFFDLALRAKDGRGNEVRMVVRDAMRVVDTGVDGGSDDGTLARADLDDDGRISNSELDAAISAWVDGEYTNAELDLIVTTWARGDDIDG